MNIPEGALSLNFLGICVDPYCPNIYATDADTGSVLTYAIVSDPSNMFDVVTNGGSGKCDLKTNPACGFEVKIKNRMENNKQVQLDFEKDGCGAAKDHNHTCSFKIIAQDNTKLSSTETTVRVVVVDQNDVPCASSPTAPNCPTIEFNVNENEPIGTVIYTMNGL